MFRKILAASVLALAPVALAAAPASALLPGQTVCYAADGTATLNPVNPDDFEYCVTRPASTGSSSGGGSTPVLCTFYTYTYSCTPLVPLQG